MILLTAKQAVLAYAHLGLTTAILPRKGRETLLTPPDNSGFQPVRVTLYPGKSAYGKRLYECTLEGSGSMTDYDKLNKTKRTQLAALTRAKHSGDPRKIITAVRGARLAFDRDGWPDQWPTWRIALNDLDTIRYDEATRAAVREENDKWD